MRPVGNVKSDGQPIPGATVRATQGDRVLITSTDANGTFTVDKMPPGAWTVDVNMFGFEASHREVQIGASPTKIDSLWSCVRRVPPSVDVVALAAVLVVLLTPALLIMQTSLPPIPLIPQPTFKPPSKLLAARPPAPLRASPPRRRSV